MWSLFKQPTLKWKTTKETQAINNRIKVEYKEFSAAVRGEEGFYYCTILEREELVFFEILDMSRRKALVEMEKHMFELEEINASAV